MYVIKLCYTDNIKTHKLVRNFNFLAKEKWEIYRKGILSDWYACGKMVTLTGNYTKIQSYFDSTSLNQIEHNRTSHMLPGAHVHIMIVLCSNLRISNQAQNMDNMTKKFSETCTKETWQKYSLKHGMEFSKLKNKHLSVE